MRPNDDTTHRPEPSRDRGISLIEMVVTIAIMGLLVTAVITAVRMSVASSATDRDQAVAFTWLQAASDEIYRAPRVPCTSDGSGRLLAIDQYTVAAREAVVPPVWQTSSGAPRDAAAVTVTNVEYLGRTSVDDIFDWGPGFCFEGGTFADSPLYTQRVTVQVTFPDGSTIQTLEMVKNED
jgi:prepilin-type N-terminal cleavage/methylation domain-containing protein